VTTVEPTYCVTVHQAAELIPLSVSMVRKLIRQGVIARVPYTGSRVLIARSEIERFTTTRETNP
jgi:excisionase family DNA binding protein